MADFILLMGDDYTTPVNPRAWGPYLAGLQAAGVFQGGGAIGAGESVRKAGAQRALSASLGGYIRVEAADIEAVKTLLPGNPVYEAGGTIEIRELPREE
jgi:hypothetical protein